MSLAFDLTNSVGFTNIFNANSSCIVIPFHIMHTKKLVIVKHQYNDSFEFSQFIHEYNIALNFDVLLFH